MESKKFCIDTYGLEELHKGNQNYAEIINKCYLTNKSMIPMDDLKCIFFELQGKLIEEKVLELIEHSALHLLGVHHEE